MHTVVKKLLVARFGINRVVGVPFESFGIFAYKIAVIKPLAFIIAILYDIFVDKAFVVVSVVVYIVFNESAVSEI